MPLGSGAFSLSCRHLSKPRLFQAFGFRRLGRHDEEHRALDTRQRQAVEQIGGRRAEQFRRDAVSVQKMQSGCMIPRAQLEAPTERVNQAQINAGTVGDAEEFADGVNAAGKPFDVAASTRDFFVEFFEQAFGVAHGGPHACL
uniref:Uncharacterized protein n=1 Tax=Ralstonia solanacearum TaxID=305 RepID=A0A0S4UF26_RALSL|nr:protein of unknown function [Ralstonia solanacearum]